MIGLGLFGGFGSATSRSDDAPLLEERDIVWALAIMNARSTENYDCLNKLACEDSIGARNYLLASKILVKGTKMFEG